MDHVNIHGNLMGINSKPNHLGSRKEFLQRYHEVPNQIQGELETGKLRLGDMLHYSIKPVGSSLTIKMFETQDDKEVGLRSISNAKLPKNQVLLLSGIYVMAGVTRAANPGNPTKDEIMATRFGTIDTIDFAALANGEFDLKVNKVQLIPETSNRIFCTDGETNFPEGYYKLHNPRQIADDVLIEATFNLGTVNNIPQDTHLFLGLHGTITTP